MRTFRRLAALCAVFLLCFGVFGTVAYAVEEPTPPPVADETELPVVNEEPTPTPDETPEETEPPIEETTESVIPGEETITIPEGTRTVTDAYTDENGRKFYTITTPAGNVFYLIVDFTRQDNNVYFLDAVTEKDLLALAEKTDSGDSGRDISAIPSTNNVTTTPEPTPTVPAEVQEETNNGGMTSMIFVVVVVLIGGGATFYFKVYRKKKNVDIRDEYEMDSYEDSYETEPEDDLPPWEDDTDYGEDENV